jgi:hypothetical protein
MPHFPLSRRFLRVADLSASEGEKILSFWGSKPRVREVREERFDKTGWTKDGRRASRIAAARPWGECRRALRGRPLSAFLSVRGFPEPAARIKSFRRGGHQRVAA